MHIIVKAFLVAMFGCSSLGSPANAAALLIEGGKLVGASGVQISGQTFSVEFVEGSCLAAFAGCNEPSDFLFSTESSAVEAANALLNQVFIDGSLGNYDANPNLTFGCSNAARCGVTIPYLYSLTRGQWFGATANNIATGEDTVVINTANLQFDTTPSTTSVFARFEVAAVPEPMTWSMLVIGFGAVGTAIRRSGRAKTTLAPL